jgi:NADH:ubiquinone oxidoreductase subunit 5 (subunit L)/multisubunit Na+/H+ antiporter MnhA subunit
MGRWLKLIPVLAILALVAALILFGTDPAALFFT